MSSLLAYNQGGRSGAGWVTFPINFLSTGLIVEITMTGYHDYEGHYTNGYPSNTGFTVGRTGQGAAVMWIAFGY